MSVFMRRDAVCGAGLLGAAGRRRGLSGLATDQPFSRQYPRHLLPHKDDDVFAFRLANGSDKQLEGDLTRIEYHFPKTASLAQVMRNLSTALHTAGYTFEREPTKDPGDFVVHQGKTWIKFDFYGNGDGMREIILKETQLTQDVVATAAALSSGLTGTGHVVVTGILFDTGKADVKPESAPALQEIVKLMQQDPKLKIYVVGHTDNVGVLAGNLDLSRRRAAAVVQVLTSQYHVAADRL
jgi:outer membrane protein OmpA-like peptidoglycan-associated protein